MNISVMCDEPNNGYFAMVFQDDGIAVSSRCNANDLYEGLLRAVADILIECVDYTYEKSDDKTPEEERKEFCDYAKGLAAAQEAFSASLTRQLAVVCAAKRLEASGLKPEFAERIAEGMNFLSKYLEKFSPEDEDELEEED